MADMPPGFPTAKQFNSSKVKEHVAEWEFRRKGGDGGQNYGVDLIAPNEAVLVGYNVHVEAEHHTKGEGAIYMTTKNLGVLTVPTGVHVGHRLTPDSMPWGAGAIYKGKITMQIVALQDWIPVALSPHH